jgi:hypothetical protein
LDYQEEKSKLLSCFAAKLFSNACRPLAAFIRGLLHNFQTGQIKLYLILFWRILGIPAHFVRGCSKKALMFPCLPLDGSVTIFAPLRGPRRKGIAITVAAD